MGHMLLAGRAAQAGSRSVHASRLQQVQSGTRTATTLPANNRGAPSIHGLWFRGYTTSPSTHSAEGCERRATLGRGSLVGKEGQAGSKAVHVSRLRQVQAGPTHRLPSHPTARATVRGQVRGGCGKRQKPRPPAALRLQVPVVSRAPAVEHEGRASRQHSRHASTLEQIQAEPPTNCIHTQQARAFLREQVRGGLWHTPESHVHLQH
jgi:hypothetical protein